MGAEADDLRERVEELEAENARLRRELGEPDGQAPAASTRDPLAEALQRDAIFRQLAEASEQALGMAALDGSITYANPALCRLLGLAGVEEARGTNVRRYYAPEDLRRLEEEILPRAAERGSCTTECALRAVDGRVTPTIQSVFLLRDAEGEPLCLANVITDISERIEAEAELRRHRDHLEELVAERTEEQRQLLEQLGHARKLDALGQLAGGIAHDFNNMLAGILGAADLLSRELGDDSKWMAHVRLITEAATRAAELTRQLLAFSRKGRIQSAPVDLHEAVASAVRILERTIDRRIRIVTRLDAARSTVTGDPAQLEMVVLNLGLNARDAMPEGGSLTFATRNVEVGQEICDRCGEGLEPGLHVVLEVSDTGVGMDAETLSRIFEPFFTTKGAGKGTGLGLAAVYGAVKDHGGHVVVQSRPGEGARFILHLPLRQDASAGLADRGGAAIEPGRGHVLVIDDEPLVRKISRRILERAGYRVTLAEDGRKGVELFRELRAEVDVVLLDLVMPEMSGSDTFAALRELDPAARVILSSGFSEDEAVTALLAAGAFGFIQKPFRARTLTELVGSALGRER